MPEASRALTVGLGDAPVGVLRLVQGTSVFELLDDYLQTPRRPVLGQLFEENPRRRWRQSQRLPAWFSNLLPEEPLRTMLATEWGISSTAEYRLLDALASDLPGALTLTHVHPDEVLYGDRTEIAADVLPSNHGPEVRFSVAGVQIKLSLVWSSNTLTLPGRGKYANSYLKFPSRNYPGVPENEYAMMSWAAAVGLPVPDLDLVDAHSLGDFPSPFDRLQAGTAFVIRRFDRSEDGARVHMEDMSQVIGNWPEEKYRGASYERLALLIRSIAGHGDYIDFVRRLTFCIAVGNEDAHLKNWTLWYPDRLHPRLSPVYDFVSTIQYEELDRGLALKFHGTRRCDRLDRSDFGRMARLTGAPIAETLDAVDETLQLMSDTWRAIREGHELSRDFESVLRDHATRTPLLAPLVGCYPSSQAPR